MGNIIDFPVYGLREEGVKTAFARALVGWGERRRVSCLQSYYRA